MDSLARARERSEMIIMTMTNIASPREFIWAAHRQTVFPLRTSSTLIREPTCHIHREHKGKEDGQTLSFGSSSNSEVI